MLYPRVSLFALMLAAAGIVVTEGVLSAQARAINAGFLKRVTQGLPFVTLKLAATLDGRIATATGASRWITGPAARRKVHAMRLSHDAVMVAATVTRCPSFAAVRKLIVRRPTTSMVTLSSIEWYTSV